MAEFSDFISQLNNIVNTGDNTSAVPTVSTTKKIKLLIVSTHINQVNGYSKVAMNIINQLSKLNWLNIVHFGTQQIVNASIGRKYPDNVKVIDGSALEKQKQNGFGLTELPGVILSEKPDIVFIYNDLSIVCAYVEEIKKAIQNRFFKIWAYLDTTYKSPPQQMIDIINRDVERIFCFTKTWKEDIKLMGTTRPIDVLHHAVDTSVIRPIPKEMARQSLGLPKDIFLITSLNKNIPRKRLDILVMSFVKLIMKYPMRPIFMLVVADMGVRGGFNLFDIFSREIKLNGGSTDTFGNRLLVTSKDTCYKDEDVNVIYNCGDMSVSCAEGEGFGLCTFEQMFLGIPQIAPEINGYTEYCNQDNSLLVKPKMRYYIPPAYNSVSGEGNIVDPDDVCKAMEKYLFDDGLRQLHGKQARETVSKYTWDSVCSVLIKRLKAVAEEDED